MLVADSTLGEALVTAHLDLHTRFPVTEEPGNPQRIVGYVNFKDIVACMRLSGAQPVGSLGAPPDAARFPIPCLFPWLWKR